MKQYRRSMVSCRAGLAVAVALTAASCAVMDSHPVAERSEDGCSSALGAYYLPKKLIKVAVNETGTKTKAKSKQRSIAIGEPIAVPDRRQAFCLDYLESGTSVDRIAVKRDANGMLERVYTKVSDKTKDIALKVLQTVGAAVTRSPTLRSAGVSAIADTTTIVQLTFDPFNRFEASMANARLTELGYCVYIAGATFDREIAPEAYCSNPARYDAAEMFVKAPRAATPAPAVLREASTRGIVYRPNLNRELVIMQRPEPNLRSGTWRRFLVEQIEMPNDAPAFSIEVPRSLFVERVTDISFNNGTLTNVQVVKPSELEVFVDIPLAVIEAVTAWPYEKLQVRINDINNQENLIRAQAALLQSQRDYNALLVADQGAPAPSNVAQDTVAAVCTGSGTDCVQEVTDCMAREFKTAKECFDAYKAKS
jgi:hypothetical protein